MLTLRAGESSLVLAPEAGGGIVGWVLGSMPLLRRPSPDAVVSGDARGFGCFPLLPFCNRIAQARFVWEGRTYEIARNFGDSPHAIHGLGWQSRWELEKVAAGSATLSLRHEARGDAARRWPFAFEARQEVVLRANELSVTLRVTNQHDGRAPAGIGLHPYFPRVASSSVRFTADGVWENATDVLPVRHLAVPVGWDFRGGRRVDDLALDNCFTGWDGAAEIAGAGCRLRLDAEGPLRFLQVYTPAPDGFFCVEPVSHMPDAINRQGDGMAVLGPGESLEGRVVFRVAVDG